MILAIDAGNTNTTFALVNEKSEVLYKWRLQNDPLRTMDEYASQILPIMDHEKINRTHLKGAILCSVVPGINGNIRAFSKKYLGLDLCIVGEEGIKIPITSLVDRPEAVGDDRLMNFVGAHKRFGGPLLVVDFGTATTFDFTDEKGNHLGGCIAPGAGVVANALSEAGALLPKLPLQKPESVIGTWTIPAMQSGVFWGYVGLFEGLITRMCEEFSLKTQLKAVPLVIGTGGLSLVFKEVTSVFDHIVPDLIFEGLHHIYFSRGKEF